MSLKEYLGKYPGLNLEAFLEKCLVKIFKNERKFMQESLEKLKGKKYWTIYGIIYVKTTSRIPGGIFEVISGDVFR